MRLHEIMTTDVQTASPNDDAEQAFHKMRVQRIRHLVVQEDRRIVGILSQRDLGGPKGASQRRGTTVGEWMSPAAVTASPTTTVRQAANLLRARTIGCLPVVEGGKLVGIVTLTDLLDLLGRGGEPAARLSGRWKPQHGSKWKPIRRIARPERPALFPH
ncbi:MAG: CBS domain-containing protein [Myxococcota bacterium]